MRAGFSLFRILFCVSFLIEGCVMLVVTVSQVKHRKEWVRAEGVIRAIETHYDAEGDVQHTVIVDYQTEDGEPYTETLGYYQSGFQEGMRIGICYDPDDPSSVTTSGHGSEIFTGIASGVCLLIAVFTWLLIGHVQKKVIAAQQNGYIQ